MNQVGAYLHELRRSRRLSLRAVADQSGVSNSYLSQIENGRVPQPSAHILQKLAPVYGVPVETLLARAGYLPAAPANPLPTEVVNQIRAIRDALTA